jgi:hypothetical protein
MKDIVTFTFGYYTDNGIEDHYEPHYPFVFIDGRRVTWKDEMCYEFAFDFLTEKEAESFYKKKFQLLRKKCNGWKPRKQRIDELRADRKSKKYLYCQEELTFMFENPLPLMVEKDLFPCKIKGLFSEKDYADSCYGSFFDDCGLNLKGA